MKSNFFKFLTCYYHQQAPLSLIVKVFNYHVGQEDYEKKRKKKDVRASPHSPLSLGERGLDTSTHSQSSKRNLWRWKELLLSDSNLSLCFPVPKLEGSCHRMHELDWEVFRKFVKFKSKSKTIPFKFSISSISFVRLIISSTNKPWTWSVTFSHTIGASLREGEYEGH